MSATDFSQQKYLKSETVKTSEAADPRNEKGPYKSGKHHIPFFFSYLSLFFAFLCVFKSFSGRFLVSFFWSFLFLFAAQTSGHERGRRIPFTKKEGSGVCVVGWGEQHKEKRSQGSMENNNLKM